jgi:hypothetical protein
VVNNILLKNNLTNKNLQVIGAGFGRSGTMSLRSALEILGYKPCYHMQAALTNYFHLRFWIRAKLGKPVNYRRFFRKYKATVDWPACEFYEELMAEFPDAKVLLNVRDPEAWYDSMFNTIWAIQKAFPFWFPKEYLKIHDDIMWDTRFNGEFTNREKTIEVYKRRIEDVKRRVPPEKLLVFNVKDGWEPLCAFLGKPVPRDIPFPNLNDRRFFERVMLSLKILEWLVPLIVLAALAILAFTIF